MIDLSDGEKLERLAELLASKVAEKLQAQPKLIGRSELAAVSGLSTRTIDRMAAEGRLPVSRTGRRVLFPVQEALAAIAASK